MSRRGIIVGTIAAMALTGFTVASTGTAHASTTVTINARSGTHTNLNVHDNSEDFNSAAPRFGGMTGLWTDTGRTDIYGSSFGNVFTHNTYHQATASSRWDWGVTTGSYSNTVSYSSWQGFGEDTTGSVVADNPTPPSPPTLSTGPQ